MLQASPAALPRYPSEWSTDRMPFGPTLAALRQSVPGEHWLQGCAVIIRLDCSTATPLEADLFLQNASILHSAVFPADTPATGCSLLKEMFPFG